MNQILMFLAFTIAVPFIARAANQCSHVHQAVRIESSNQNSVVFGRSNEFRISGLQPCKRYTVKLYFKSHFKALQGLEKSSVVVESDSNGSLSTATMKALAGSYTGIDQDGLFWSRKVDNTDELSLEENHFRLVVENETGRVQEKDFKFEIVSPTVTTVDVPSNASFVGKWFIPPTSKNKVVVVTLSGSEGGLLTGSMMAASLANNGIPSLAISYFNSPGLPKELDRIPLEYFQRIFNFLKSDPATKDCKIVVMGTSRGAELSLLLGSMFPQVQGVIALAPSPFIWGANRNSVEMSSAWTLNGQEIPYLFSVGDLVKTRDYDGTESVSNRPAFEKALEIVPPKARPRSFIERTRGPILMIAGSDDQVWPAAQMVEESRHILSSAKRPFHDEAYIYPGAGHDFNTPGFSTMNRSTTHELMGVQMALGGTPEGAGHAATHSWRKILELLRKL